MPAPSLVLVETLADYAAAALADTATHHDAVRQACRLRGLLQARAVIDQAEGILVVTRRCSPDEAFALLVADSRHQKPQAPRRRRRSRRREPALTPPGTKPRP